MIGEPEMNDIAYVLSRNTPLRTLNLSDNAVDAKAALVLAESLGSNSHLRELDLRNNRLGDAGVAVLMEPFILQRLQRAEANENKSDDDKEKAPTDKEDDKVEMIEKKSTKKPKKDLRFTRKLKMKLKRLLLDNN